MTKTVGDAYAHIKAYKEEYKGNLELVQQKIALIRQARDSIRPNVRGSELDLMYQKIDKPLRDCLELLNAWKSVYGRVIERVDSSTNLRELNIGHLVEEVAQELGIELAQWKK